MFPLGENVPWNASEGKESEGAKLNNRIIVQNLPLQWIFIEGSSTVFLRRVNAGQHTFPRAGGGRPILAPR